jgi:hypothetical protein
MKQDSTPWWICDKEDNNYCVYIDTDSNYFNAEPLLRHIYPNFDELPENEKDDALEKVALKYQDIITNYYDTLSKECFNVDSHRLEMKTECVIRSAYFRATRRYAQWITKKEGITKESLDIKGLEFMKTNFPPVFGKFFEDILEKVIKGTPQHKIDELILSFQEKIINLPDLDITLLGNPTSVKTLNSYIISKPKAGEFFTKIEKGAPANVTSSIRYNDLLRLWKLDKTHNSIIQGDKIKWVYLNDNPYKIEKLAFLEFDIPDKVLEFLKTYINRKKSFETVIVNKLEGFYSDIGWKLNLNSYTTKFFNF